MENSARMAGLLTLVGFDKYACIENTCTCVVYIVGRTVVLNKAYKQSSYKLSCYKPG